MPTLTHDIIINGAGPTGATLALMLAASAAQPQRIALAGHMPLDAEVSAPGRAAHSGDAPDPRTLALNHGSRLLLQKLGAWPAISADIRTVHVSQRSRLGRTVIDSGDLGVPRLGSVVSYDALLTALHARLQASGVDLVPASATDITVSQGGATARVRDGLLTAALVVHSHGHQPQGIQRNYEQHALLTTARASHPRSGWAYERFTRQGPLALLPHPQDPDAYAVVWCCPPAHADDLKTLPAPAFDAALNRHFGDRLGRLQGVGERHVFPLSLHTGPLLLNARTLAIGNAAQTLHPVAGQGLNLGLRDVAQLGIVLAPWLAQADNDIAPYLQEFVRRRRPDRWLSIGITDLLPRIFVTGNPVVEHGCGLALLGLDLVAPARNGLARQLLQGLRV